MDSINSQQIRSKSTVRATGAGFNSNKIASLQTMAYTADQHSLVNATGLASIQALNKQRGNYERKNIDRCALLEEIEKNKIDELKLKTLKNADKYSNKGK